MYVCMCVCVSRYNGVVVYTKGNVIVDHIYI